MPARLDILSLNAPVKAAASRRIFDPAAAAFLDGADISRETLSPGQGTPGPAAITERETTLIVPALPPSNVQRDGSLRMEIKP